MLVGDQIGPQHQPPQQARHHSPQRQMAKSATSAATIVKTKVLMMDSNNADNIHCDETASEAADDHDNGLTCQRPEAPAQKVDLLRNCSGIR